MSLRSDRLSRFSSVSVDTRFTNSLIDSGNQLRTSRFSVKIDSPIIHTQLLEHRSPVRGFRHTRSMIRKAILNHEPLMIRYRKQPDRSGNQEIKNYVIEPLELKIVRIRGGKRVIGVYASKRGTRELRLFLMRDIIMCRYLTDQPVKSARDRVLERP